MPKQKLNENELRKVINKYVHPISSDTSVPDIQKLIHKALKDISPNKEIDQTDVSSIVSQLAKGKVVNNKLITETAKKVVDDSAMKDLKFMIGKNAQTLGKTPTSQDVDSIIKQSKLNSKSTSLLKIKQAVNSYYSTGRPLEHISTTEIKDLIKKEIKTPIDDKQVSDVLNKYMSSADQDKPFDPMAVQAIIKSQLVGLGASKLTPPTSTDIQATLPKPNQSKPKQGPTVPPKDLTALTFFEKIRLKLQRYGIKSLTRGSRNWLTDNVNNVSKSPSRKKFLTEGRTTAETVIGKMFMYFYDAKTKKELPYWDKFPLIFVIDLKKDGWLGINLHYLDIPMRLKLFDKLLKFADDKSLDKITKLRLSYGLLKKFSQFPEVRPCIKRYLADHVKSELLPISAIDWETALFLPVEQFQKTTKETVWKESKRIASRR